MFLSRGYAVYCTLSIIYIMVWYGIAINVRYCMISSLFARYLILSIICHVMYCCITLLASILPSSIYIVISSITIGPSNRSFIERDHRGGLCQVDCTFVWLFLFVLRDGSSHMIYFLFLLGIFWLDGCGQ
jgi:hypothetical protein